MHQELYKKGFNRIEKQQNRQSVLLQQQKERRLCLQDENRQLITITPNVNKNSKHKTKYHKRKDRTFKQTFGCDLSLQLSEWLRECPENLCDWLLVPCPRGQRCFVVAYNGRTEVYDKSCRRFMRFQSMLPGDGSKSTTVTLLDCIYVKDESRFYILDALYFGNQYLIECEAQFRFFWIRSKLEEEHENLDVKSEHNQKPFKLLETYDFEYSQRIALALQRYPHFEDDKPQLDGFLFYHKEASYTCGQTPLVCWLFPFMVPDLLGMCVSECYKTPVDYKTPLEYMNDFDKKLKEKIALKTRRRTHVMDIDIVQDTSLEDLLNAERCLEIGAEMAELRE